MGNHEWDDDHIEQLLSNAPKMKDDRPKEDILARLKSDPRLAPQKKKSWNKWVPASVTAAALLTMGILVSSYQNVSEMTSHDSAADHAEMATEPTMKESISTDDGSTNSITSVEEAEDPKSFSAEAVLPLNAVYQTDLDSGFTALHLSLSSQAVPIPVTFLISNDKIAEDFGDYPPTILELYREYADDIDENAFGFSEYHPMVGDFKEEGKLLIHTLPEDHPYDMGGAAESGYFETVKFTFQYYDELIVNNKSGTQAEFAHTGAVNPIELTTPYEKVAFYLYTLEDNQQLLVPYNTMHEDLQSSLEAMKVPINDYFQPVIPEYINFTVTEEKGVARVSFTETLDLQSMNPNEAGRLVEGILLTAASFGMQIQFENIQQGDWNGFDFTQPLPMPIGPNKFYLN